MRAALGAASELLFTLTESWTNELSPNAARGRVMAAYTAALSLGFAAGPALLAAAGLGRPRLFRWRRAGAGGDPAAAVAKLRVPEREEAPPVTPLRYLRLAPVAIAATLLNAAVETAGLSFITLYATRMGWSQTAGMHLITTLMVGAIVLQLPIGWLADRLPGAASRWCWRRSRRSVHGRHPRCSRCHGLRSAPSSFGVACSSASTRSCWSRSAIGSRVPS